MAKPKTNVAALAEVKAAQAFLKALGASTTNYDLIYAVVAWMRQESGGLSSIIGNNPFNIRPSKSIDEKLIAGIRHTKGNGDFLIFTSLQAGFIATAQLLLRAGNDWRGYGLIVRAAQHGSALDFLTAIALSAWNASHYGYNAPDPMTNHLVTLYLSFTGLQLPPTKTPKPPARKPIPHVAADANPGVDRRHYLDAFRVEGFYRARHSVDRTPQD